MKTKCSVIFGASAMLAMAFTLSCSSDDDGGGCSSTASHYCSNGTGELKEYGYVSHGGQTYKTVVIGTQTWMAEDLKEGGQEKWFSLDEAKSACMAGWHLPTYDDWNLLVNFVGGRIAAGYQQSEIAKKLQSKSFGGTDNYGFAAKYEKFLSSTGVITITDNQIRSEFDFIGLNAKVRCVQ